MGRADANLTNGRITTLPKWAQKLIADLQRDVRCMTETLQKKFDSEQEKMESWQDHVIFEDLFDGVDTPSGKRVINASSLTFRNKGVRVSVRPSEDYFDIDFDTDRYDTFALIEPRASNRIRIVGTPYQRKS